MKTKGAIWDEYTIVEFKDDGKTPKTVQCKHPGCDYRKAANQNRMLQHWRDKHTQPEEVEDALPVDTPLDTPLGKVEGCGSPMGAPQKLPTTPPPLTPPTKAGKVQFLAKLRAFGVKPWSGP